MHSKKRSTRTLALLSALTFISCSNEGVILYEFSTHVTGILPSYIANAAVCLDTKQTYTCKDETTYLITSDARGHFHFYNVPNTALNKYNIVAETNDLSTSGLNGKLIGEDYIFAAPGYLSRSDKTLVLSPLLSVLTKYSDSTEFKFHDMYSGILRSLEIHESIDLTLVEYNKNTEFNSAHQALHQLNESIFLSDKYHDYFINAVSSDNHFESEFLATKAKLTIPFSQSITPENLHRDSTQSILRDETFATSLSEENKPSSIDERFTYYEEVESAVETSNMIRETALAGISAIPVVGKVLGPVIGFLWDAESADFTEMMFRDAKRFVREEIIKYHTNVMGGQINTVKLNIQDYLDVKGTAPDDVRKRADHILLAHFNAKNFFNMTALNLDGYKYIPQLVLLSNLRMMISKEMYVNHAALNLTRSQAGILSDWVDDYKFFKKAYFNGDASLYQRFMNYRSSLIKLDSAFTWGGLFNLSRYANGKVDDLEYSDFSIHYTSWAPENHQLDTWVPSINNLKAKRIEESRLNLAKQLSAVFLYPAMFPKGTLTSSDFSATEIREEEAFYIPETLQTITINSISTTCVVSSDPSAGRDQECLSVLDSSAFKMPINAIKDIRYTDDVVYSFRFWNSPTQSLSEPSSSIRGTLQAPDVFATDASGTDNSDYHLIGFKDITFSNKKVIGSGFPKYAYLGHFTPLFAKANNDQKHSTLYSQKTIGIPIHGAITQHTIIGSLNYKITDAKLPLLTEYTQTLKLEFSFYPYGHTPASSY